MFVNTLPNVQYSLEIIQEEARRLVEKGIVSRKQSIYTLRHYISVREWASFEIELEKNEILLRDRINDLLGREEWDND